jgi:PAS domain S-box-containing protein
LKVALILFVLATGALMAYFWRLVVRGILRPLHQVEVGTQRIALGNFTDRLNLPQRDEIGQLAAAFDSMTSRVQTTQVQLQAEVENSHRAETALQEGAQYTQAILDNAVDGIITFNNQGVIQSANPAVAAIFGYQQDQLIGQYFQALIADQDFEDCNNYLDTVRLGDGAHVFRREVQGRRKGGASFPMDMAISPTIHNGQPLFIGLLRDISERHRIDRMKSEFVSTVSHELRTPLTSIRGALGLITAGALGEPPGKMKGMIKIAHDNTLRLLHLINDLLDMDKLAAGQLQLELQDQALMPLIEESLEANRSYGQQFKVRYELRSSADDVRVRVEAVRLQQVIANFLSNAAKFSPADSVVEVSAQRRGEHVRIEVRDHGPGIPDEFRARIFQKFSQADSSDTREKGGTGLGLAISKELIERMHGQVGFTSEPNQGACFYIELPLASG